MPYDIRKINVLTADRSGIVSGVGNIRPYVQRMTEQGRIAAGRGREEETLQLEISPGLGQLPAVRALAFGMVLDVLGEDDEPALSSQYIIRRVARSYAGGPVTVDAAAYWHRLRTSRARLVTGQRVDRVFSLVRRTPQEALEAVMASAPAGFLAGDTAGLSADQQAVEISASFADDTHLAAIERLCEVVAERTGEPCEWDIRRSGDYYYIDLVQQIGVGGNTYVRAGGAGAGLRSNRIRLDRTQHGDDYFSRVSAVMGDEAEGITLGQDYTGRPVYWHAQSQVQADGLLTLTLEGRPVPYDGWGTAGTSALQPDRPHYYGSTAQGFYRIAASTAPGTITLATGLSALEDGYFAEDAAGTVLDYILIRGVEADYGEVERSEKIGGALYPNLLRENGITDDFSEWEEVESSLLPTGWTLIGAPTITQVSDERATKIGAYTARIECGSVGQGIRSAYVQPSGELVSALVHVMLESGEIRLRLVDEEGGYFPRGGDAISSARTLQQLAVGAWSSTEPHPWKGPVAVEITATKPGTVLLDAATLTPSNGSIAWSETMGGRDLWAEAGRLAVLKGGEVKSEYQGESVDLSEVASMVADRVCLGAVVTVQDGYDAAEDEHSVSIATRVLQYARDILPDALRPRWTLEAVRDDLADLLIDRRRPEAGPRPPSPTRPAELPRLLVQRIDRADVDGGEANGVRFVFGPKNQQGEPLENFEIFASVNDADFATVGTDEDRLRINLGSIFPIGMGFGGRVIVQPLTYEHVYPPPDAEVPDFLRFYVVDRASGLRSSEYLATVVNPKIDLSRLNGQITANMIVEAAQSYGKTFTFSAPGWQVVSWTAGTLTFLDGSSYAIASGTTGLMAPGTQYYIYFDKTVSTTELQVTTDPLDYLSSGAAKLVGWAHAAAVGLEAFFVDPQGVLNLTGEHLSPESVDTNAVKANAITTVKLSVGSLAALFAVIADLSIVDELTMETGGRIVAGSVVVDDLGIRSVSTPVGGEAVATARMAGGVLTVYRETGESTDLSPGNVFVSSGADSTIITPTSITVDSHAVWHEGNLQPNDFLAKAGGFTGTIDLVTTSAIEVVDGKITGVIP